MFEKIGQADEKGAFSDAAVLRVIDQMQGHSGEYESFSQAKPEHEKFTTRFDNRSTVFDFDLAEFPWSVVRSNRSVEPIVYEDSILGKDEKLIERKFVVYPHPTLGHATGSTVKLAFLLMQMYAEQPPGFNHIHFGTVFNLGRMLQVKWGGNTRAQIIRDLQILSMIQCECVNAAWDDARKVYVSRSGWKPFGEVNIASASDTSLVIDDDDARGSIGFSWNGATNKDVSNKRAMLELGFGLGYFLSLTPTERRLVLFLARRLAFSKRLFIRLNELAWVLQISGSSRFQKRKIKEAMEGLVTKGCPLVDASGYHFAQRPGPGRSVIHRLEVKRKTGYKIRKPVKNFEPITMDQQRVLMDIIQETEDFEYRYLYKKMVQSYPLALLDRALSEFKELYIRGDYQIKKTKGAAFTSIVKRLVT